MMHATSPLFPAPRVFICLPAVCRFMVRPQLLTRSYALLGGRQIPLRSLDGPTPVKFLIVCSS
jgi:hypothetical protein